MENKWLTRVKEHYDYVCEKYGKDNVLGVFLYGSQNYGLATEESDVDTKAILIPTLWDIAANKQPVSKELHMENGEHIEVKDIRLMCEMWKKQNINFIEILFTEYRVLNPDYTDVFKKFELIKEGIAFYNPNKTIISAAHQLLNTLHQATRDEIIDNKKLANCERLANFLYNYQAMTNDKNKDYSCLLKNKSKYFLSIKMDNFYKTEQEKKERIEFLKNSIETLIEQAKAVCYGKVNETIETLMASIVKQALLKRENL